MLLKQVVATRKMCLSKDEPLTHGGDSADVSNFAVPQPCDEAAITAMDLVTNDSNENVEEHQKHLGLERSTKPVQ